jgi:hypothetical protein
VESEFRSRRRVPCLQERNANSANDLPAHLRPCPSGDHSRALRGQSI